MLEAVIFDLDGVILDSHPAHLQAWRAFFQGLGKDFSDEELGFVMDGHMRAEILHHFLGNLTDAQVRSYGKTKDALFREFAETIEVVPGLREFLDDLRRSGVPAAIASSASRDRAEYMLDQLNLKHHFQAIATAEDVAHPKPDPEVFLLVARQLNVAPENALVCEDAVAGVRAARSAGMRCLAIAGNGRSTKLAAAGADPVLKDFTSACLNDLRQLWAKP